MKMPWYVKVALGFYVFMTVACALVICIAITVGLRLLVRGHL